MFYFKQEYKILKINSFKTLKPVNISAEQQAVIKQNLFAAECSKFFKDVRKRSLNSNIYLFGHFANSFTDCNLNDKHITTILFEVKKLMSKDVSEKNINLINVIYSTLIKHVTPENIISGQVRPETYRKLIDESIKTYKTYPIQKDVDYRHILGRMVSFKDMSFAIQNKLNKLPKEFKILEWTENEQFEMVNILERILMQYKNANLSFVEKVDKNSGQRKKTTIETFKHNYLNSVMKLLWMLLSNTSLMFKNINDNITDIIHNIDIASFYSAKIPFEDTMRMPKLWKIHKEFKKMNDIAQKFLKNRKTKQAE